MDPIIPDKYFYKIGEVAEITSLEPYVLRYWETEFHLKLTKTKNNQRLYQKKDIRRIQDIKKLLYEEKFTIKGAKKKLKDLSKVRREEKKKPKNQMGLLDNVKSFASDREVLSRLQQDVENALTILDKEYQPFDGPKGS
jgi:DNA-binding transcriptional MerR regulator